MASTRTTLAGIAIDCGEGQAPEVGRFYEELLGYEVIDAGGPNWRQLGDPRTGLHLNIQGEKWYEPPTWPEEPGRFTKMLHFEVMAEDLEAALGVAVQAGGREASWQPPSRDRDRIRIMLDPAGHPLCVFLRGE
jgi:hypothetical protein